MEQQSQPSMVGFRGRYKTKAASNNPENIISPKTGDYYFLIDHLNDYTTGSNRNGRSRGVYQITRQESGHESVLNSKVASVPPHDQELKIYSKLKSGEFNLEGVDAYRKDLVQQTISHLHDSQAAKQIRRAAAKKQQRMQVKAKSKTPPCLRPKLDEVEAGSAQTLSSSVGATFTTRDPPSAPPLPCTADEAEPPESPLSLEEAITEPAGGASRGKNKYSLSADMSSPFVLPSGRPRPARKVTTRRPVSSRSADTGHKPAVRKKVTRPDGWVGRVPADWNCEGGGSGDLPAKHPSRLRHEVAHHAQASVEYQHRSDSEATWRAIKRKHDKERSDRRAEISRQRGAALARYDSCSQELLQMGFADESMEKSFDQDVLVGVPSAMGLEGGGMEGLMSLEELEELSVGSSPHEEGEGGGEREVSVKQLELEDPNCPEEVLAGCLGKLLFAGNGEGARVRPVSAGLGGVCPGAVYACASTSPPTRPHSAHPANSVEDVHARLFDSMPVSHPYKVTAKRAVITRSRRPSQWIS